MLRAKKSLCAVLLGTACHGAPEADSTEFSSCDPLVPEMCALPFPSSFYLRDADTETGFQVSFASDSLPVNRDGVPIDPIYLNEKDGFATAAPLYTWFEDLSLDGVVGHENIADYTAADAKILLVDTETGKPVPVWGEIDMTASEDGERLFILWPAVPLEHARRYVIGLRGLTKNSGDPVDVSEAFAALRDGTPTENPDIEGRRSLFDDTIFPALEAQGAERADLQLAWDFVTASRENTVKRMEFIRDDGLARIDQAPTYEISSMTDYDCVDDGPIARDIKVKMTLPLYTDTDAPNTLLTRDADGMPYYNGDTDSIYLVRIPCSVAQDPKPAPILQYGHGLLGSYDEAYAGWLADFANDSGYVVIAHTWFGLSTLDSAAIAYIMVADPSRFAIVPERSHQGLITALAAMRITTSALVDDDAVKFDDGEGNLVSVVDPERRYYYGNSQGGILGGAYVAISPDLDRGVLGVPGMPYALLLTRSCDFDQFFDILKEMYDDHREILLLLGTFQMLWDSAEPAGWVTELGEKHILMQDAIGDCQVSTLGAQFMARAYGASTVAPETRSFFGVEEQEPGFSGSALVEFLYTDVPAEPVENVPASTETDTHECPRREEAGQMQVRDFLEDDIVNQYCDGVCGGLRSAVCGG